MGGEIAAIERHRSRPPAPSHHYHQTATKLAARAAVRPAGKEGGEMIDWRRIGGGVVLVQEGFMYDYAGVNAFSLMQSSHTTHWVSPRFSDGFPAAKHRVTKCT